MGWTIAIVALPLLYYAAVGVRLYPDTNTMEDFFIYRRSMGGRDFSETFVATTLSLATELTFYLSFGANSGIATLWAPVSFVIGTLLFIYFIHRFEETSWGKEFLEKGDTIIEFVSSRCWQQSGHRFASKSFAALILLVSVFSLLSIFVIEMFVVTQVFSVFDAFSTTEGKFFILIAFTCLVLIYVYLAGFKSVIRTDHIQIYLMVIAVVILIGTGITYGFFILDQPIYSFNLLNPLPSNLMEGSWSLGLGFLASFFAINFYRYISYIGSWQRILAVGNGEIIRQGLKNTIWGVLIIVTLLTAAGMLYSGISSELGQYDAAVLTGYLNLIQDIPSPWGNILLGFVLAGLVAALISTADSHIVACLQVISFDATKIIGRYASENQILVIARRSLEHRRRKGNQWGFPWRL